MDFQRLRGAGAPNASTIESEVGSEIYQELVGGFVGHLPGYLTDLDAAAAVGDVPAARYVAHQIKGNALSFGAVDLDELADRLLQIGKGEAELLVPLVAEIRQEIGQLRVELGGTLETDVDSAANQQLLADFLGHLPLQLVDLREAAAIGNLPAARYVAYQIKGYAPSLGAASLDALAEQLLSLEHGDAASLQSSLQSIVAEIEVEAAQLQPDAAVATLEAEVGTEVYQLLRTEFLMQLEEHLVYLTAAAATLDVAGARYVAHQLKGSALSFGAVRLDGLVERVLHVEKDEGDVLQLLVGEIDKEVNRLRAAASTGSG